MSERDEEKKISEIEAKRNTLLNEYLKEVAPISRFINDGFEAIDIEKNVKDGVLGFAIGDALGVPVEFSSREELERHPVTDMEGHGVHNQPKGTWSDDTSMMIATMDAITNSSKIDYGAIADNFCLWATNKKFNPHGKMFDIGITTSNSLNNYLMTGCDPTKAGRRGFNDNGNGSLMRILPLAYYFKENNSSDNEIAEIVNNVSSITHAHPISCLGCYLYVKYAMSLIEGKDFNEAYEDLKRANTSMYDEETIKVYDRVISGKLSEVEDESDIKSSGFVVDSLEASIWCCLKTSNYKDAVLKAVNLGNDTDTIGGLAGGLAGIKYGIKDIPSNWLDTLVKKDYLTDLSNEYQSSIKKNAISNKTRHI